MASQYPPSAYSTTGTTVTIYSTSSTGTILNSNAAYSNYGINNGSYTINTAAASSTMWSSTTQAGLNVTGDSVFDGDVTIKGRSLEKLFNNIERRLAILQPNPKKLEKFEALQKAYDHYKLLEALLHEEDKDGS
jgi:hypothetical protein